MVVAAVARAAMTAMAATEGKQNPTTVYTAEKEAAQHRPGKFWQMLLLLPHLSEKASCFVPKKKYANAD